MPWMKGLKVVEVTLSLIVRLFPTTLYLGKYHNGQTATNTLCSLAADQGEHPNQIHENSNKFLVKISVISAS